jgi:uncharacterized protein YggE
MLRSKYICLAALLVFALSSQAVQAQFGPNYGGVSLSSRAAAGIEASGTATVQRKPTQLRLYMELVAKGKTLPEALAKLKERREAATAQLETLKADKNSIVFGAPTVPNTQSPHNRQIEAMVMAQMRSRGKKAPKGLQVPHTVTVAQTLTAQWPLEGESLEQMLLMAQNIQEKIKAADLAGAKESEALSAEEEEFAEEANQMANQFGAQQQSGEAPHFLYVATLPAKEREEALAQAFKKAIQHADETARAAGLSRGPMVGLSSSCAGQSEFGQNNFMGYDPTGSSNLLRRMITQQMSGNADGRQDEAMSAEPGLLQFNCHATVVFQVGTGK